MLPDLIQALLKTVHQHYPVGLPHTRNDHEGHKKIRKIVTDKINNLIAHKCGDWEKLVAMVSERYEHSVRDMSHLQFPCYQMIIDMAEHQAAVCCSKRKIVLSISLVGPYYTLFYEDEFRLEGYMDSIEMPPLFSVLFTQHKTDKNLEMHLDAIKKDVAVVFPDHQFTEHGILFKYPVHGVYNYTDGLETTQSTWNFYQLLFDGFFFREHYEVKN